MNLNELLLNAYKNSSKSTASSVQPDVSSKKDMPSTFKSFVPPRIEKVSSFASEVVDKTDKDDEKKVAYQAKPLFQVVNQKVSEIFEHKRKSPIHSVEKEIISSPVSAVQNSNASFGIVKVPKEDLPAVKEDSVFRRVAKFLMIIGTDEAAKILPHLSAEQTEKIIPEIASIESVDPMEAQVILKEFQGLLEKSRESGGVETARAILEKTYGSEKARQMLDKAAPFALSKPFEYLDDADPERISLLLNSENEGIQALVLSHLNPKKAAAVLNVMETERKALVVRRLAKLEKVSPEILKRIDKTLHQKSLAQTSQKAENIDGRNVLAQILKRMDPATEKGILTNLAQSDPELGNDLRQRLFTIDDVIQGDDRFIQELLRTKDDIEIAKLIAFKDESFRNKILGCISSGRKANVLEEEKLYAPFRRVDCDIVTNDFFTVLRRAYEDGKFIIKNRNDDVYV